jgi:26S proteasome regulatory subunit N13
MIFPGDAKFEKVKQSNDRVYLLEFSASNQRHFYWMQEKEEEGDAERCKKINNIINDISDSDKPAEGTGTASAPAPASAAGVTSSGSAPVQSSNRPQVRAPPATQPPNPGDQMSGDLINQFLSNDNMKQMLQSMQK